MSMEDNKTLIRRYQEAYNRNELDELAEILSPSMVMHNFLPGLPPSLENARQIHLMAVKAYPDFHTQIDDLLAEGDKVVMRSTLTGTHQGEFMGVPPSGVNIKVTGISIFRIANGKIVEHWGEEDSLGWLQQIGAIPKMG